MSFVLSLTFSMLIILLPVCDYNDNPATCMPCGSQFGVAALSNTQWSPPKKATAPNS